MLKSGYWQEGEPDEDIDILEWFAMEEFLDEPQAAIEGLQELTTFTVEEGKFRHYRAPEYRRPPKLQLDKRDKFPPPVDQGEERVFVKDMAAALAWEQPNWRSELEGVDVVTTLDSLRMLLAFVDGTLVEDMAAKGFNTRLKTEPVGIDMMRVLRMKEAPDAIALATVWAWCPRSSACITGNQNRMSYDECFVRAATGQEWVSNQYMRELIREPMHYRILKYKCGGLKTIVRVPVLARVPSVDRDAFEPGQTVDIRTANWRDAADLWGEDLCSRYADMQFSDTGFISRAILKKGHIWDMQEITQEDFRLDRPKVPSEAGLLIGRVARLLRRIKEVADSPGCKGRLLYLQYFDSEIRVITPRLDRDDDDEEAQGGPGGASQGELDDEDEGMAISGTQSVRVA